MALLFWSISNRWTVTPTIRSIRKLGRNIIAVNFKYSFDANQFAQSNELLPSNWLTYIPNYKIIRTGVVRGVDPSLSSEKILQGIKWRDKPMEIKSIERLKYRDTRNNGELRDSTSVKIDFVSNLLPEYITIWSVKSRVKPFVNKVRKCFNCLRWGHSSAFCRDSPVCSRCGERHDGEKCSSDSFLCPDCKQIHAPFEKVCPIFLKYELVNAVMAFCNVSQFNAKKLIKSKGIIKLEQVYKVFKSSAYLAWNNADIFSNLGTSENSYIPSTAVGKTKKLASRRLRNNRLNSTATSGSDQLIIDNNVDMTLMPSACDFDNDRPINF